MAPSAIGKQESTYYLTGSGKFKKSKEIPPVSSMDQLQLLMQRMISKYADFFPSKMRFMNDYMDRLMRLKMRTTVKHRTIIEFDRANRIKNADAFLWCSSFDEELWNLCMLSTEKEGPKGDDSRGSRRTVLSPEARRKNGLCRDVSRPNGCQFGKFCKFSHSKPSKEQQAGSDKSIQQGSSAKAPRKVGTSALSVTFDRDEAQ